MQETGRATATFLFTDIEGSTQLLKTHRTDYSSILADHHRILRQQFAAHDGREVPLPTKMKGAAVESVAAAAGVVWATTPDDRSRWRIDSKTNSVTRIAMPFPPQGVATGENEVWVTVRR